VAVIFGQSPRRSIYDKTVNRKRRFICNLAVLLIALSTLPACRRKQAEVTVEQSGPAQQFVVQPAHGKKVEIVAYGDVRFADPSRTRESNPAVRRAIVQKIAEEKPDFVVFTGDLVLAGDQEHDWQVYQQETQPWRDAHIRLFTVPGNHDVVGDPRLRHYFTQFPDLKFDRWYTLRAANVLVLMLDSNADAKGGPEWQWIEKTLDSVPQDVDFVLIALHHPPMTKSHDQALGGGHSVRPQEAALGAMIEQHAARMKQKIIVIAGHVHNYERYSRNRVTYIVSGGGGATPYRIERAPGDVLYGEPFPNYHICDITVDGPELKVRMNKVTIENGKAKWDEKDSVEIDVPTSGKPQ
jgi:Icc-related predicted phosphoesterase